MGPKNQILKQGDIVCKIPLLARRTRPSAARDDRVSCIQIKEIELSFLIHLIRLDEIVDLMYSLVKLAILSQKTPKTHQSGHISKPHFALYTRYPIVARRAWSLGRVRRASKGILHTTFCPSVIHRKAYSSYIFQ